MEVQKNKESVAYLLCKFIVNILTMPQKWYGLYR